MAERVAQSWAPGRVELAGNHTDHQGGRVVSAAVDQGVSMQLQPRADLLAHVESEGFEPVRVDLRVHEPQAGERRSTAALVRGVCAGLLAAGVPVSGFDATVRSTLPSGGGLSSSAAFEMALARGLCALFAAEQLPDEQLAVLGQRAEADWFGKPCGLQDQTVVLHGGVCAMDFARADEGRVEVQRIEADFAAMGLAVCLADTHCDHSLLTDEFSQVVGDMEAVARMFGASRLCQVREERFLEELPDVRRQLGDRAALRALHYFREMQLVNERIRALRAGDAEAFLQATRASGASSAQFLQNVSVPGAAEQPAMVAIALVERALAGRGACRIHGGGFGGSVQAFVPASRVDEFARAVDGWLGAGSVRVVGLSPHGAWAR